MSDLELIRQAAGVGTVLLLLAAALWWLRRKGLVHAPAGPRGARRLRVVERLPLGPQHSVCLLRMGDRGILVGLSPGGCAVLESAAWERFEGGEARS